LPADPARDSAVSFPDSGKRQLVSLTDDTWGTTGRMVARAYRLREKFGLADTIGASRAVKSAYSSSDSRVSHNAAAVGLLYFFRMV